MNTPQTFGASQSVRRREDVRFVTGQGNYLDDLPRPEGLLHAVIVRSAVAAGTIERLDTEAAKAMPGVQGVFTAHDLQALISQGLPCTTPIKNRDGQDARLPVRPLLCQERVLFAGDAVAVVVAATLHQARDAAEAVMVDIDPTPVSADPATTDAEGQPQLHPEHPHNIAFDWEYGDAKATEAAFAKADHVVELPLVNNRVIANSMEPRGCQAHWESGESTLMVYANTQGGWDLRDIIAKNLSLPSEQVRVITPDVGGGFGMKGCYYPEQVLCAVIAWHIKAPVRWVGDRSESFLTDIMGRDHVTVAKMALNSEAKIQAVQVETTANMGAYLSQYAPYIPAAAALKVLPGVYDFAHLSYRVKGVYTHTTPVDAYRGAGRPESIYVIERLMDVAAHQLGLDSVELRRRNFIKPAAMPYTTAAGETYDSGHFEAVMDKALDAAGWDSFPERRDRDLKRGFVRGIGMCYYIESTMGNPNESADVHFTEVGEVELYVGTQSNGQGHETVYPQILSQYLGIPAECVRVIQGDTALIRQGGGTGGSRSVTVQGTAIKQVSEDIIEKGLSLAADHLEAGVQDIVFEAGKFMVRGSDKGVDILTLARSAPARSLNTRSSIKLPAWTFPNGCHIAEVSIDVDTGQTRLLDYTVVDDFGVMINPMLVEGQVHGGVVQGLGQALMEHTVYAPDGQLLSGSFMDYAMPRASDIPMFSFSTLPIPCANNPLGMKGCGEAGTVGALASVINAIHHALQDRAGRKAVLVDMPATPQAIWNILHSTS